MRELLSKLKIVTQCLTLGGGDWNMRGEVIAQSLGLESEYAQESGDLDAASAMTSLEAARTLREIGRECGCTGVWAWQELLDTAVTDAMHSTRDAVELTGHVSVRATEAVGCYRGDPDLTVTLGVECGHLFTLESGTRVPHPLTGETFQEDDEARLLLAAWTVDADVRADLASQAAGTGPVLPESLTAASRAAQQARTEALYRIGGA